MKWICSVGCFVELDLDQDSNLDCLRNVGFRLNVPLNLALRVRDPIKAGVWRQSKTSWE